MLESTKRLGTYVYIDVCAHNISKYSYLFVCVGVCECTFEYMYTYYIPV